MEAKQYPIKQPMDHWRNQRGNQKIPGDKRKWKHDDPKPMGYSKSSSRRVKFIATQAYLRNQKKKKKFPNNQPKLTPKARRKRTNKTQS